MGTKFSEDVVPLTDLKVNPGRVVKHAVDTRRPVLLTSRGRGVAVVQSVSDYESSEDERAFMRAVVAGLIRAENAFRIAVATLNNAMGVPEAPEYEVDDNLSFDKYEMTFEDAIDNAYRNRPDLASLVSKRQASEKSIELAKTGYYPALTGNAGYTWGGENFPLDDGWNAGVTLSVSLFSGFLTTYQVAESKANLNVIKANEVFLKQSIYLEVQQAYLTLRAAEEAIPTAKLGVDQAKENLDIANGRYTAGVGNRRPASPTCSASRTTPRRPSSTRSRDTRGSASWR